jgi:hypothetical protein
MSRSAILAALCFATLPAIVQAQPAATPPPAAQTPPVAPPAPPSPPPAEVTAVQQAAMAFGQCVQTGVQAVPATVTPEAGATGVVQGCAAQRQRLEQAAQALIATIPEAQRPAAQEQLRTQLAAVEGQVAAGIRQMRGAAAPAPAPAPAPTPGR